jgi:hypothetical protein
MAVRTLAEIYDGPGLRRLASRDRPMRFSSAANIEEYYEEAITVGLPPYDGCKFTENRFRNLSGAAPRTFYGSGQESSSGIMDAVKGLFGKKDS